MFVYMSLIIKEEVFSKKKIKIDLKFNVIKVKKIEKY